MQALKSWKVEGFFWLNVCTSRIDELLSPNLNRLGPIASASQRSRDQRQASVHALDIESCSATANAVLEQLNNIEILFRHDGAYNVVKVAEDFAFVR